jgi:hypothetical protein
MTILNRDPQVSCPPAVNTGKVCSHAVTDAQLTGWGFTTRRTDKIVGTPVVTREGVTFREAIMGAWNAGHLRICSLDPRTMIRRGIPEQTNESRADAIAWVEANRLPTNPKWRDRG